MSTENFAGLTANVVAAYVSNNTVPVSDLPALISEVNAAISGATAPASAVEEVLSPAVSVKKSVTPDFIICLDDGKNFKSLKRHLRTAYNLTPDEYRRKWNLPADYPMVAPNYSQARSALAQASGLGQGRRKDVAPALASVPDAEPATDEAPAKRTRKARESAAAAASTVTSPRAPKVGRPKKAA